MLAYNADMAGWHTFYILPLLMLLGLVMLAISLPLACMGVWIKDTALAITYILRVAFYASPILYGIDMIMTLENIPMWAKYLCATSPIGYVITAVRQVLLQGQFLDLSQRYLVRRSFDRSTGGGYC